MLYSVYPTDDELVFRKIISAVKDNDNKMLFTSLHIPEADNLFTYLEKLRTLHEENGFTYFADISPHTLRVLDKNIEELIFLKTIGVIGLRIDFGFTTNDILKIAELGFEIAVNASVVEQSFLKELVEIDVTGWHNYYPRPETGISEKFYKSQNDLFKHSNKPVYTFIPGEQYFRKPLCLGLPTLETQRHINTYVNYLYFAVLYPQQKIVLAEGICFEKHIEWIKKYEQTGIITVPLVMVNKEISEFIENKIFTLRTEETDYSHRLEETRGCVATLAEPINSIIRTRGSLQMDTDKYGRYQGELHIIKADCPFDFGTVRVGEIPSPYIPIVDIITGGEKIEFVIL